MAITLERHVHSPNQIKESAAFVRIYPIVAEPAQSHYATMEETRAMIQHNYPPSTYDPLSEDPGRANPWNTGIRNPDAITTILRGLNTEPSLQGISNALSQPNRSALP